MQTLQDAAAGALDALRSIPGPGPIATASTLLYAAASSPHPYQIKRAVAACESAACEDVGTRRLLARAARAARSVLAGFESPEATAAYQLAKQAGPQLLRERADALAPYVVQEQREAGTAAAQAFSVAMARLATALDNDLNAEDPRSLTLKAWDGFHAWAGMTEYGDDADGLLGDIEECAITLLGPEARRLAKACHVLRRNVNRLAR